MGREGWPMSSDPMDIAEGVTACTDRKVGVQNTSRVIGYVAGKSHTSLGRYKVKMVM